MVWKSVRYVDTVVSRYHHIYICVYVGCNAAVGNTVGVGVHGYIYVDVCNADVETAVCGCAGADVVDDDDIDAAHDAICCGYVNANVAVYVGGYVDIYAMMVVMMMLVSMMMFMFICTPMLIVIICIPCC